MSQVFLLSKAQMARLAPLLPDDTRGVARVDDRRQPPNGRMNKPTAKMPAIARSWLV